MSSLTRYVHVAGRVSSCDVCLLVPIVVLVVWGLATSHARGVPASTLGCCIAAPMLFLLLTMPWKTRARPVLPKPELIIAAGAMAFVGIASDLFTPVAIACTLATWAWLDTRLTPSEMRRIRGALLLTLFVLPWIEIDFAFVSLSLRQAASGCAQHLLSLLGVLERGSDTVAVVAGQQITVVGGCDGRDTLQMMLMIGFASASYFGGSDRPVWIWSPVLILLALIANTVRVVLMCLGALFLDMNSHGSVLHDVGGWLTVLTMGVVCVSLFAVFRDRVDPFGWCLGRRRFVVLASWRLPRLKPGQLAVWILLFVCVIASTKLHGVETSQRLRDSQALDLASPTVRVRQIGLNDQDRQRLGEAEAVKHMVSVDGSRYVITTIDGTRNRHAVHDPTYCWEVLESSRLPVPGGYAKALRVVEDGCERDLLFWFSNGRSRHASPARYLLQTSLRRVSRGTIGCEPVLVVIQAQDSRSTNWFRFLDRFLDR